MARRSSSNRWLQRQARDSYVKQRGQDGYRSRAAYKLQELNQRDRLIRPASRVLDLGAAPGGWSQVATRLAGPSGTVVALDVLKMEPIAGATIIQGDCRDSAVVEAVGAAFAGRPVDLVMSDMAPNISGIAAQDGAAASELAMMALTVAQAFLDPGGALLIKLFQYPDTDAVIEEIRRMFAQVSRRKPDSSRAQSREFYVVAKQFGI